MFETAVIATAFPLGFLGGLHCVGMCGPIAVALSRRQGRGVRGLIARLSCNGGRIISYTVLGLVVGALASGFRMAGFQQWLSIVIGAVLLLGVILPSKWTAKLLPAKLADGPAGFIKRAWSRVPQTASPPSQLLLGVLNGFLPCGLVYTAAAAAGAMGSWQASMAYMAWFGLGTIPAMLLTGYAGMTVLNRIRFSWRKLTTVAIACVAVLLILRGLNLGIPCISPKMNKAQASETVTFDCCQPE